MLIALLLAVCARSSSQRRRRRSARLRIRSASRLRCHGVAAACWTTAPVRTMSPAGSTSNPPSGMGGPSWSRKQSGSPSAMGRGRPAGPGVDGGCACAARSCCPSCRRRPAGRPRPPRRSPATRDGDGERAAILADRSVLTSFDALRIHPRDGFRRQFADYRATSQGRHPARSPFGSLDPRQRAAEDHPGNRKAMYTPELLRLLYAHMEWADARVWSEVLGTEGVRGDPWLRDRLFHIHDTQQAFLSLWTGQPRPTPGDLGPLTAVCEWARPYYATARLPGSVRRARAGRAGVGRIRRPHEAAFRRPERQRHPRGDRASRRGAHDPPSGAGHDTAPRAWRRPAPRGLRDLGVVGEPRRGMGRAAGAGLVRTE